MATVELDTKIEQIRDDMPAVRKYAYLNTGTFGPLPTVTAETMAAYEADELNEGRITPDGYPRAGEARNRARAEVAQVFGAKPENIALTRHTTDGMNVAILGLNWRAGDELIITDLEHPGGQAPAYNVARRFGVTVRLARLGDGTGDVVGKLERLVTPRTRMIVVSHLTWNTGTVLPLAEIVAMAHRHGVLVATDAAQSAGSVPINLPENGVDVYAMPGQKWLCGPEGTGAVYVSDDALDVIQPTVVGYASAAGWEHAGGYYLPSRGAARYEVGGSYAPQAAGQASSVNYIRETVGLDWAFDRIARLGQYAWERISSIDGVSMITPRDQMAGLTCFTLEGITPPDLTNRLFEHGVIIRYIGSPLCARVSTGFYNTADDIDRLVAGIKEIKAGL